MDPVPRVGGEGSLDVERSRIQALARQTSPSLLILALLVMSPCLGHSIPSTPEPCRNLQIRIRSPPSYETQPRADSDEVGKEDAPLGTR